MKKQAKGPPVPAERHETVRKEIVEVISGSALTAKDISGLVRISEKEVYDHLEHISLSLHRNGERHLITTPSECSGCGFIFKKRERLKKPGRCPVCRSESIIPPTFSIR